MYGFQGEVQHKYDSDTFSMFLHTFKRLPLGHVIGEKVLVLHGGLFEKEGVTLKDINKIERRITVPKQGIMCDMLWADPGEQKGKVPNKRGVSIEFGVDVAEKFLDENNLDLLIRSHQVKDEGFEMQNGTERVLTVFSAPNYCD